MSSRKRTKRKNSDEDFDVDEGNDEFDIDEINKWACHSCTFVNRAAAFRCFVCGTRKGTSTRRSRCDDNVVEMQKSITTMVQKQVEKEKSLKRKEQSNGKSSMTRETSEGRTTSEVKTEELDQSVGNVDSPTYEEAFLLANTLEVVGLMPKPPTLDSTSGELQEPIPQFSKQVDLLSQEPEKKKREYVKKKKVLKLSRESTPGVNGTPNETTVAPSTQNTFFENRKNLGTPHFMVAPKPERYMEQCPSPAPIPTKVSNIPQNIESISQVPPVTFEIPATPSTSTSDALPTTTSFPLTEIPKEFFTKNLPASIVKQLNLPETFDLAATQKLFGIKNSVVSEPEPVVQQNDWERQRTMRDSLGSQQTASPTTSRQSSETDSSSSDGNRSFDTPHTDTSRISSSKCCQIPDYMIHRDTPQKFVIVANGLPAYFEEFPRRIH